SPRSSSSAGRREADLRPPPHRRAQGRDRSPQASKARLGRTASVQLPLRNEKPVDPRCRVSTPPGWVERSTIPLVTARVLLVEPNRIVRAGIRAELSRNGADVVAEAASGAEALAAA